MKYKTQAKKWITSSALLALLASPAFETISFANTLDDGVTFQQSETNKEAAASDDSPQVSQKEYEDVKSMIEKGETYIPSTRSGVTHTQTDAVNWANSQVGKSIDADGQYGAQCVDLIRAYSQYLFGYQTPGYAYQFASMNYQNFTRIPASQTDPQPGDVVVWTGAGNGHVGIVISASGSSFTTVEQNVNNSPIVQRYSRNKNGLMGGAQPFYGVQRPNYRVNVTVPNVANGVHRLYNPGNGDHYYTASQYEAQSLVNSGWQYDGVAFKKSASGGTPIYMLYNPNSGEHFITASSFEANSLASAGWRNQGVAWTAPNSGSPVHRLYNPNGFHFWTTSVGEKDSLVRAGWRYEGVSFYG